LVGGLIVDLVISSMPSRPHLRKILAYSSLAIRSLIASLSVLAIGEPFEVTNPTGVVAIWPRNLVPAIWATSYFSCRVGPKYRPILPLLSPRKIAPESL
jgi:hypothetical protein